MVRNLIMNFLKALTTSILTLALLLALLWQLDWQQISAVLGQTDPLFFLMAILLTCFSYCIHAMRWKLFFSGPGTEMHIIFKTVVIGHLFNALLPSKAGEIIRPIFLKRTSGIAYTNILATCLVERIFDGVLVLGCLGLGAAFLGKEIVGSLTAACIILGLYFLIASILIALYWHQERIQTFSANILNKKIHQKLESIIAELSLGTRRLNKLKSLRVLAYTIVYCSLNVAAVWCALRSINLQSDLQTLKVSLLLVGTLGISLALPSPPANMGVFHFTVYSVLVFASGEDFTSNTSFISAAIVIHLAALIPDLLVGGLSYFSFPKRLRELPVKAS